MAIEPLQGEIIADNNVAQLRTPMFRVKEVFPWAYAVMRNNHNGLAYWVVFTGNFYDVLQDHAIGMDYSAGRAWENASCLPGVAIE